MPEDSNYIEKSEEEFNGYDGDAMLRTGVCYKDGDALIPLFEEDETFTIRLDLDEPVFRGDYSASLSTPFEFVVSDALSGISSVSAQQGEDTVEYPGDEKNSNILLACETTETAWKCTLTVHTKADVVLTATDRAGNSARQELLIGDWKCNPKFHVESRVLTIPDSVEMLTSKVLDGCADATEVVVGKGVGSIDAAVFDKLTHVKSFRVEEGNAVFSADNDALYEAVDEGKKLIRYPQASK